MIDRAIGGHVPKVQDYLFINRAVESLVAGEQLQGFRRNFRLVHC